MIILNKAILLLLFVGSVQYGFAQTPFAHELKVGDHCPDFIFSNIINYKTTSVHLSDFKGKLVILDFWATWCSPCLNALPKLDSIQKAFSDSVAIITISGQETDYVSNFLSKNKKYAFDNLMYVTNDVLLRKYFPYRLIPHEVWIDGNGNVKAITGDEEVNEKNIKEYFDKTLMPLKEKKDIMHRNTSKPLLAGGLGDNYQLNIKQIAYQSLFLTGYIDGAGSGGAGTKVDGCYKRVFRNMIINNLYLYGAFGQKTPLSLRLDPAIIYQPSRIILEIKDSSLFSYPGISKESWALKPLDKICFTYEQYVPEKDSLKVSQYMLSDLNRYFGDLLGIEGVMEKRKMKYWTLTRISKVKTVPLIDTIGVGKGLKTRLSNFISYLMFLRQDEPVPIVDNTGYGNPEAFFLKSPDWTEIDLKDLTEMNNWLSQFGLCFNLVDQDLDMIVIRNKRIINNHL